MISFRKNQFYHVFIGFVIKNVNSNLNVSEASELLKHIFSVLLHNVILISGNIVDLKTHSVDKKVFHYGVSKEMRR